MFMHLCFVLSSITLLVPSTIAGIYLFIELNQLINSHTGIKQHLTQMYLIMGRF